MADDQHTLDAQVLTPEGEVFSGELTQLSTRTTVGEVGILARHAPMVARLVPAELRLHVPDGEVQRYAQGEGWLEVFANRARVLIAEAIPPDQLEAGELRERLDEAEQRLSDAEEGSAAHELAEREKARVQAFLDIAEGGGSQA
jgi:F-type H+-transporting ATPase subunit epsilon